MTIKRRLFISNILMIVVPVLLIVTMVSVMTYATINILGIQESKRNNDLFYHSAIQVQTFAERWSQDKDLEQIKSDIDTFWGKYGYESAYLSLYQSGEQQYAVGNYVAGSFTEYALSQENEFFFTMGQTGIYKIKSGEYTVLLGDEKFQSANPANFIEYYQYITNIGILMIIVAIMVVFLTNRLLTRMIIKSIVTPLDTLVYGVHQIRDGNLSYRIKYEGKDEFAAVCADFNEMAERLLDMVNARQKDAESRKELIAGISHDLRTPLTSIKTYVEGIELGMASTPEIQKRYLSTIKGKTKDLEHIINQLFLFSKLDIGEFPMEIEPVDIGKFLFEFIKIVSSEYEQKGLRIEFTEETQEVMVRVDKVQFGNVLINLLENSVKYGDKEQGIMHISCHANSVATVVLSDNGPGVPEDSLEKLFDLFYREDKARSNTSQGSGLGLAISAKIMKLLGGSVRAVNPQEGGLSITLTLPIERGDKKSEKNINH